MKDVENVGIMQGFMDSFPMDDDEEGEEGYSSEELIGRKPDSPEILMNNLRGDYRSIDARREELADLVGYNAAEQTPDEVLAMLQPVLARGGIGGLSQSQPMAQGPQAPMMPPPGPPPTGGPPPGPPPGAPPMPPGPPMPQGPAPAGGIGALPQGPQPPMGMAKGGPVVQNFQTGSDPDGVEAKTSEPSGFTLKQLREFLGEEGYKDAMQQNQGLYKPIAIPTLEDATAARIPQYERLLGQNKNLTQAQMLFDIAGAGLALAGNVDPRTGQPLRGSFVSRLAGAASQLPAQIGARAAEAEKMTQQIKLLGMQAAEKEIERKSTQEIARKKEIGALFRKALETEGAIERQKNKPRGDLTARAPWNQMNALLGQWVYGDEHQRGDLTPEEIVMLQTAVGEATKAKTTQYVDEYGKPQFKVERGVLPYDYVRGYVRRFGQEAFDKMYNSIPEADRPIISRFAVPSVVAQEQRRVKQGLPPEPTSDRVAAPQAGASAAAPQLGVPSETRATTPTGTKVPNIQAISYDPNKQGLWQRAEIITGPIDVLSMWAARNIPIESIGQSYRASEQAKKDAERELTNLVTLLATNANNDGSRYVSKDERVSLEKRIDVLPRALSSKTSYETALISLHDELQDQLKKQQYILNNQETFKAPNIMLAREKANAINSVLGDLNLPPMVFKDADRENIPRGTYYLDRRNPDDIVTVQRGSIRDIHGKIDNVFMGEARGEDRYALNPSSKAAWERFYAKAAPGTKYIIQLPDGTRVVRPVVKPTAQQQRRPFGTNVPNADRLPPGADDW
jgi:hypothetical protein